MFESIVAFAIGIIVLCLIAKIISLPLRLIWKLITNSIVGAVLLWLVNLFGLAIHITFLKALIAGVFGVPGVLAVIIMQYM